MPYTKAYAGGWQNGSAGSTPIDAAALNTMETGIQTAFNNFQIQATAPVSPSTGHLWYDTTNALLKQWSGSAWTTVQATVSASTPSNAVTGQQWFSTANNVLHVYNGSAWVPSATVGSTQAMVGAARATGAGFGAAESPIKWNSILTSSTNYNASTGLLTCPYAGKYFVQAHVLLNGGVGYLYVAKNGSVVTYSHLNMTGSYAHLTVTGLITCAVNDTLGVNVSAGYYYTDHNGFAIIYLG